jgi:hypothetical protein
MEICFLPTSMGLGRFQGSQNVNDPLPLDGAANVPVLFGYFNLLSCEDSSTIQAKPLSTKQAKSISASSFEVLHSEQGEEVGVYPSAICTFSTPSHVHTHTYRHT